jgi:hypothetical protein
MPHDCWQSWLARPLSIPVNPPSLPLSMEKRKRKKKKKKKETKFVTNLSQSYIYLCRSENLAGNGTR